MGKPENHIINKTAIAGTGLTPAACRKARLARDTRFDGLFFTAVKTTGIFCRPICAATPPLEKNVVYLPSTTAALNAGYRPCLRCRPDSAPGSSAWKGVDTTLERALQLIDQGALQSGSLAHLCQRLGISDRYLRKLFQQHLGLSPKRYALQQQCLFAKQLLHQSRLAITQVALASGFNSIRRFNDCFKNTMGLTPSQVRRSGELAHAHNVQLKLHYRPPYNWEMMQRFLTHRCIPGLEWLDKTNTNRLGQANNYGRTFQWQQASGYFTAEHQPDDHAFIVTITMDDLAFLKPVVNNIKRLLDINADINRIERGLHTACDGALELRKGLRLPGIWSMFEAGVRAILGQQVSVTAARKLVTQLTEQLGGCIDNKRVFPTPEAIAASDLSFFKMPGSRKQALQNLARHYLEHPQPDSPDSWLALKGIGPWTVDYACMRGLSNPDIYLGTDLGIKKALINTTATVKPEAAAPWRSYLTLQLWNQT